MYYDAEGKPLDARYNILQDHLSVQDLQKLKVEELNPLTPEVISRQATINIGTIGHVAHGKSAQWLNPYRVFKRYALSMN